MNKEFAVAVAPAVRVLLSKNDPADLVKLSEPGPADLTVSGVDAEAVNTLLAAEIPAYIQKNGAAPKSVCVENVATFTSVKPEGTGRLAGKVCIVTGSAQGLSLIHICPLPPLPGRNFTRRWPRKTATPRNTSNGWTLT